jgi:hypothetical protein
MALGGKGLTLQLNKKQKQYKFTWQVFQGSGEKRILLHTSKFFVSFQ